MTDQATARPSAPRRKAGLFDLRWIIALLFAIYGVALIVVGLAFTTEADIDKAAGANVNLWTGVVMALMAAAFAVWAQLRPLAVPTQPQEDLPESSVTE